MDLLPKLWSRFVRRPGLPGNLGALVWLFLVTVAAGNVEPSLGIFLLVILGAMFLGGLWTLHALIYFFRTATLRMRDPLRRGEIITTEAGTFRQSLPIRSRAIQPIIVERFLPPYRI